MRARLTVLLVALCALAVPATAVAAQQVFVPQYLNEGPPQVRPHAVILAEDGTLSLYGIHYESYGGAVANATGRGYVRGCTPDCAQGKVYRPQATISFSQVMKCEGKLIYARLRYSFVGAIPSGFKRTATFDLRPLDESGKPAC